MRDEQQEGIAIHYIESNPVKAKLCRAPEEWSFGNAKSRDANRQLVLNSPCAKLEGGRRLDAGQQAGAPVP